MALPEHLRQITVSAKSLTEHMLKIGARMREFAQVYMAARARMGLSPVPVEIIAYARAVEVVGEPILDGRYRGRIELRRDDQG